MGWVSLTSSSHNIIHNEITFKALTAKKNGWIHAKKTHKNHVSCFKNVKRRKTVLKMYYSDYRFIFIYTSDHNMHGIMLTSVEALI